MPRKSWAVIGKTSGSSGATPTGGAPDVIGFNAGILNPDGTFTAAMRWDDLKTKMLFDWGAVLPASTANWSAVQIFIKLPDGSYVDTGNIARAPDFSKNFGAFVHYGGVAIEGAAIPAAPQSWTIIACSYNLANKPNLDVGGNPTGPTITLMTQPGTTAALAAPPQPLDADWTIAITRLDHDPVTGQNSALIEIDATFTNPTVNVFSVYQYQGDARPADPALWVNVNNTQPAVVNPTTMSHRINRQPTPVNYQFCVVTRSPTFIPIPGATIPIKQLVIPSVTMPAQCTAFSVTVLGGTNGGVVSGKLTYVVTPPVDLEFFSANIYRQETDAAFNALPSPNGDWSLVANVTSTTQQRDWWVWINGLSYWKFKCQSVSRALLENTLNPPMFNLAMPASPGVNMNGIDLSSLDTAEMNIVQGRLAITSLNLTKALGASYDNAEFKIDHAVGRLVVNGVNLQKVIATTVTTELGMDVFTGKFGVQNLSAAKVTAGTLAAGVIYAGSITTSQLLAGTLAAGTVYAGQINVGQINAGVLTSVTINASQINSGTLNSVNISAGTLTLNANGITTTISNAFNSQVNSYLGLLIQNNSTSSSCRMTAGKLYLINGANYSGAGSISLDTAGAYGGSISLTDTLGNSAFDAGVGGVGAVNAKAYDVYTPFADPATTIYYRVGGQGFINKSAQFVGAGVNCGSGIAGSGFNIYGGSYFGQTERMFAQVSIPANPNGFYAVTFGAAGVITHQGLEFTGGIFRGYYL
ncbi:MAG: hypothetical protein NVS9B4_01090 [Candidatus Acidiferrum sp.]